MSDVVVVTPTVAARRGAREVTLAQWRALGHDPIVVEQPADVPHGHRQARATAQAALAAGLAAGAELIVFAEDDIDLDPRIPEVLGCDLPLPLSLWHRPRFRPAVSRRVPLTGLVEVGPARARSEWWGSQCVVLDRHLTGWLLDVDWGRGGIDMDLRLLPPIHVTVPSLVGHRRLPRLATRGRHYDADDYEGPRLWA